MQATFDPSAVTASLFFPRFGDDGKIMWKLSDGVRLVAGEPATHVPGKRAPPHDPPLWRSSGDRGSETEVWEEVNVTLPPCRLAAGGCLLQSHWVKRASLYQLKLHTRVPLFTCRFVFWVSPCPVGHRCSGTFGKRERRSSSVLKIRRCHCGVGADFWL